MSLRPLALTVHRRFVTVTRGFNGEIAKESELRHIETEWPAEVHVTNN